MLGRGTERLSAKTIGQCMQRLQRDETGLKRIFNQFKPKSSRPPNFSQNDLQPSWKCRIHHKTLHRRNCQPHDQDRQSVDRFSGIPSIQHSNAHPNDKRQVIFVKKGIFGTYFSACLKYKIAPIYGNVVIVEEIVCFNRLNIEKTKLAVWETLFRDGEVHSLQRCLFRLNPCFSNSACLAKDVRWFRREKNDYLKERLETAC